MIQKLQTLDINEIAQKLDEVVDTINTIEEDLTTEDDIYIEYLPIDASIDELVNTLNSIIDILKRRD